MTRLVFAILCAHLCSGAQEASSFIEGDTCGSIGLASSALAEDSSCISDSLGDLSCESSSGSPLLKYLGLVGNLKHLPRTGWVLWNVKNPETVAGHMYRMAMMTFLMDPSDSLDVKKCLDMTLVHDLAESLIGDLTPHCGVSTEEKHKRENAAMKQISELMGKRGSYIYELFMEYENRTTPEAKFVKELDVLDMRLQAFEYEKKEGVPQRLQDFFSSTEGKFSHPLIKSLDSQLRFERSLHQTPPNE